MDKHQRPAPQHVDPNWVPPAEQQGPAGDFDRKLDPDGTDEFLALRDDDDSGPQSRLEPPYR